MLSPASYVPNCVLMRHARLLLNESSEQGGSGRSTPSSQGGGDDVDKAHERVCMNRVNFTLLILDVSGFTKISGWLQTHKGQEGPELMSEFLSQYFHRMLDIVAFFGGDVLKFAGDALLVTFCASPNGVRLACLCAATATKLLNNYVLPGDVPHRLSLHAAVDVGQGEEMFVGGVRGRWEHCVSGTVFSNIGTALDRAAAGTVLVSSAVEAMLRQAEAEKTEPGLSVVPEEPPAFASDSAAVALFRIVLDEDNLTNAYPQNGGDGFEATLSFVPASPAPGRQQPSQVVLPERRAQRSRRFEMLANSLPIPLNNKQLQAAVKRRVLFVSCGFCTVCSSLLIVVH
jgi:class 3 adenylate cyclase